MGDSLHLSATDLAALAFFLVVWVLHTLASDGKLVSRVSLTTAMNAQREAWMRNMAERDQRARGKEGGALLQPGHDGG
ncbi:DUF599 family protein, partial [Mesorhizobium sp. M1A.F.Ca.IN.020.06.1.1]|uniref:DUF599 family protein n=1 Tax=Mesorhizobium sp. M1A.F.Ca.IN.020.06.1.1 TaxID=2496765 RepID=UPI000FD40D47